MLFCLQISFFIKFFQVFISVTRPKCEIRPDVLSDLVWVLFLAKLISRCFVPTCVERINTLCFLL